MQQQSQQVASNPFTSSATAQPSAPAPSNMFGKTDNQQQKPTSNIFGQSPAASTQQKASQPASTPFGQLGASQNRPISSIIGQNGQPQPNQPTSNLFGSSKAQQGAPLSNVFGSSAPNLGQAQSPENSKQNEDSMSTTPDTSPQTTKQTPSNPFASLNVPASPTPQRGTGSFFSNNPISPATSEKPEDSAQPKHGGSLFDRIAQPTIADGQVAKGDSVLGIASETRTSIFAGFGQPAQPISSIGKTSSTKEDQQAAKPLFAPLPSSQNSSSPSFGNIFSGVKAPSGQPSSTTLNHSVSQAVPKALEALPSSNAMNSATLTSERPPTLSTARVSQDGSLGSFDSSLSDPPSFPSAGDEEEKRSQKTRWRLRALNAGITKLCARTTMDFPSVMAYYEERKQAIINAAGRPLTEVAGSKRKFSQDEQESSSPKKAKSATSLFESATPKALANVEMTNGISSNQNIFGQASPAKHSSPAKRKADECISKDTDWGAINGAKKARFEGTVSYPSLSSSTGSETSNIFKSIVNNEEYEPTSGASEPASGISGASLTNQGSGAISGSTSASFTSNGTSQKIQDAIADKKAHDVNIFPPTTSAASSSLFSNPNSAISTSSSSSVTSPFKPTNTIASPFSASPAKNTVDKPTLQAPKFDSAGIENFLSQFAKASQASEKKDREKRKADDYDSDEENEAEWERKDAEEQRAKKQKLEESMKGKAAKFVPGKGFIFIDDEEEKATNKDTDSDGGSSGQSSRAPSLSVFDQPPKPMTNGLNIFSHLSEVESGAEGSKTEDADDEDTGSEGSENVDDQGDAPAPKLDTDSAPLESQALASGNPFNGSNTSKLAESMQSTGRSLFDRISRDEDGQAIRELPPAEEKNTSSLFNLSSSQIGGSNVFGKASSSTPSNNTTNKPFSRFDIGSSTSTPKTNLFGQPSALSGTADASGTDTSPGDHTWKVDSPIRFGDTSAAPSVQITSPSPSKNPFGGLFGSSQTSGATETPVKPTSSLLGITPTKSPDVGFGFSFGGPSKSNASILFPPPDAPGHDSSRATSPGASSVTESADGSVAAVEEKQEEPEQLDLTKGPEEEDEETLFEVKGKALTYDNEKKEWINKGVGPIRILKHTETGKTRILMRQDPSGKIVLNAALLSRMEYKYAAPKSVTMPIATDTGTLATYTVRVGKDEDAKSLAKILQENKSGYES